MERDEQKIEIIEPASKGRRFARGLMVAGGIAAVAAGGIGVATATGVADGMGHYVVNAGMNHGMGFAGHGFARALDAVDVTPEQEEKIWAIIDEARAELRPMMREFRGTREAVTELIGAATLDREAAETLRAERIAMLDDVSRKMTAALIEAAEVLTPEQRAKLIENFEERRFGRRW